MSQIKEDLKPYYDYIQKISQVLRDNKQKSPMKDLALSFSYRIHMDNVADLDTGQIVLYLAMAHFILKDYSDNTELVKEIETKRLEMMKKLLEELQA